jgi:hypothetical protein
MSESNFLIELKLKNNAQLTVTNETPKGRYIIRLPTITMVDNTNVTLDMSTLNNATGNSTQIPVYIPYGDFSVTIMGVIALPVEVFGIIANILSVTIFTHRVMRNSPINWYGVIKLIIN